MRHQQNTKKFKRTEEERKRLWKDLTTALITNGTIITFTARAKWFRPKFERLVTLVKRAGSDTQLAFKHVRPYLSEKVARKLIEEVVPTLLERTGGYTVQIKVFQEFSPHDKSIVKITPSDAPAIPAPVAELESASEVSETVTDVTPKKVAKKPTTKKATKTVA